MNTFLFQPKDTDTLEEWSEQFRLMYSPRQPVHMIVRLDNYKKFDIQTIVGLKVLIDMYRPMAKMYLTETHVYLKDPLLKTLVKSCLYFFKHEKPVVIL
jgi:hypothetical protein